MIRTANRSLIHTLILSLAVAFFASAAHATPSTQVWIPSTDIQAVGTFHLGIDNYFSGGGANRWSAPTDIGLTWGPAPNWEVGIDVLGSSNKPLYFNFKYGVPEKPGRYAFAVGNYLIGTGRHGTGRTDFDTWYVLGAKSIPKFARLSIGAYSGNSKLLLDLNGAKKHTGILVSLDRQFTKKIWGAIDYQGGKNVLGAMGIGFSYAFAPNVSVIFGYVIYNEKQLQSAPSNTYTTQLDINF